MKISNPLTIIAVFAGVAESFATNALINLPIEVQHIFIYFVMLFPIGIVVTFFLILVFKPHVLYAPSDYDDQEHFLLANKIKESVSNEAERILSEVNIATKPLSEDAINQLKNKLTESAIESITVDFESRIYDYISGRPNEVFTVSGLGHTFALSTRTIRTALV